MTHQPKTAWHHLYDTSAWRNLRRATYARDAGLCQRCGILCRGKAPSPISPVCDHITPHKGDHALFHDPANLQTLCKGCHDTGKQGLEARGYGLDAGLDGWPTDPRHPANRC